MIHIPPDRVASSDAPYRPVELTSRLALKVADTPLQRLRWLRLISILLPKPHIIAKVGIILAEKAGKGRCWPSLATMAKEIGCTAREVSRATKALETTGLLQRTQRFNSSTVYLLTYPPVGGGSGDRG